MPVSDQGVNTERYQLIPRTLIFLTRGESVLLLKGAAHKRLWANRYNGVGGHIERGEDVLTAARRGLLEEPGRVPDDFGLAGTVTVDTGQDIGIGLYVLKGACSEGIPRPAEEGELEWVAFEEIGKKDLVDDLPILLPRIIQAKISDPPFAARYFYDAEDQLVVEFAE